MSSNPWSVAFKRAIEVEEEGAKDFVEILAQHAQKKLRPTLSAEDSMVQNTGESAGDSDEVDGSGAVDSGLSKLSKFVIETTMPTSVAQAQRNVSAVAETEQLVRGDNKTELVKERDMVEVCGRQMCRAWLKHHYLKIGSPCKDGDACLRKHAVTCKPELLYKDYSFKGLSPKQRKSIMEQIKAENSSI